MKTRIRQQQLLTVTTLDTEPPLSPRRAFVVQFRVDMGVAPEHFTGRVEHIVTGHAGRFYSPEELIAFFTTVLSAIQD